MSPMQQARIRPLAICVFRRGERILVAEGYDRVKGERFYRPLGGAIKFGEYAPVALVREIQEELGMGISGLRYLGTLENLFTYEGQQGHEIVLVRRRLHGRLEDPGRFSGRGDSALPRRPAGAVDEDL